MEAHVARLDTPHVPCTACPVGATGNARRARSVVSAILLWLGRCHRQQHRMARRRYMALSRGISPFRARGLVMSL
jgi:hypothetical protein